MTRGTMAKMFSLIVVAPWLTACIGTVGVYDAQVASGVERRPGGGCAAPQSKYSFFLPQNVKVIVRASTKEKVYSGDRYILSAIGIELSVVVPNGHRVRLESPIFYLSSPDLESPVESALQNFSLVIYGTRATRTKNAELSRKLTFSPVAELVGGHQYSDQDAEYAMDRFTSALTVEGPIAKTFTLTFPRFVVDGDPVQPEPVMFVYRKESYWLCFFS